ncbi:cyclic nucleotide-binding/CBS domain-containing protein [Candidatus Altiarchaeota archaeon]
MEVKDVMTQDVIMCSGKELVHDALRQMIESDVGCIVVEKDGKPVGILTNTDVITRVVLPRKDAAQMEVRDIMTSPVASVHTLANLSEAVALMNKHQVKRLVVLSDNTGTIAGLVSTTDLVVAESKLLGTLQNYIRYMKGECDCNK